MKLEFNPLKRSFYAEWIRMACCLCLVLPLQLRAKERLPWKNSHVHGTPDAAPPYQVKRRFPNLQFKEPVDMESIPGSENLAVLELSGKLYSFKNEDGAKAEVALDLKKQSFGFAFHPQFVTNHFIFVSFVVQVGDTNGTHLSRFTATGLDPLKLDQASEKVILTWPAGGHNGGALQFGNDGFLYVSTGES